MKNLFKLISALLIAYCTFCFVNSVSSQNTDAIRAAFSNSYTYENKADYTKAIEELKKVYKDDSYEINVRLGWLNYMSELFKESITYYQKAMKLMPLSIEAKLGYVLPQSSIGKWDVVKDIYEEILKTDPMNSTVNYRMGMIYYGKQDYNNAYKYFEKVVNLYPFDYDSNLYFAWTNLKLNKSKEAKVLFNKVLLIKPNDSSALEGLGIIK